MTNASAGFIRRKSEEECKRAVSYRLGAQFYDLFDTKSNIDFYKDLANETKGKVLELGCGTGRVLFEIGRLGKEVCGVDNSPHMLAQARNKLKTDYRDVEPRCTLIEADMASVDLEGKFGLIYSASGSLNLPSREGTASVLDGVVHWLDAGGLFAFDLIAPRALRKTHFGPSGMRELEVGTVVRYVSQHYDERTDVTTIDVFYEVYDLEGQLKDKFHEHGIIGVITRETMEKMLRNRHLRVISVYGDFGRNRYARMSPWLVFTVTKEAAKNGSSRPFDCV